MIYEKTETEDLFIKGLVEFNNQNFYDAHEYWEELWSDYKIKNPLLIQGLIQFSVGCFHLTNLNRNGAIGLFNKSIKKLENFKSFNDLKINISDIVTESERILSWLENNHDLSLFNWDNLAKGKWVKKNCGEGGICHSAFVSIINETTGEVIVNNIELFAGDSFARTWTVYNAGIYKITVSEHSTARCKNLNYSQETKYTVKASDVPQPPNGEGDTLSTPPTHDVTNAITMMSMLIGLSVVVYKYYFD